MWHGWGVLKEIQKESGVSTIYEGLFFKGMKHGHGTLFKTSPEMKFNNTEKFTDGMWKFGVQEGFGVQFRGNN